ncbi:hypothetical protein ACQEU3_47255 [Spirillospora sp. CA-253888]
MKPFDVDDYITVLNGTPVINAAGMALLMDIPSDVLSAELKRQMGGKQAGAIQIPDEWVRRGRRNAKRCAALTGSYDFLDALRFLHEERVRKDGGE